MHDFFKELLIKGYQLQIGYGITLVYDSEGHFVYALNNERKKIEIPKGFKIKRTYNNGFFVLEYIKLGDKGYIEDLYKLMPSGVLEKAHDDDITNFVKTNPEYPRIFLAKKHYYEQEVGNCCDILVISEDGEVSKYTNEQKDRNFDATCETYNGSTRIIVDNRVCYYCNSATPTESLLVPAVSEEQLRQQIAEIFETSVIGVKDLKITKIKIAGVVDEPNIEYVKCEFYVTKEPNDTPWHKYRQCIYHLSSRRIVLYTQNDLYFKFASDDGKHLYFSGTHFDFKKAPFLVEISEGNSRYLFSPEENLCKLEMESFPYVIAESWNGNTYRRITSLLRLNDEGGYSRIDFDADYILIEANAIVKKTTKDGTQTYTLYDMSKHEITECKSFENRHNIVIVQRLDGKYDVYESNDGTLKPTKYTSLEYAAFNNDEEYATILDDNDAQKRADENPDVVITIGTEKSDGLETIRLKRTRKKGKE